MIKYYTKLCVNSRQTPLTISHEEVNSYNFEHEAFLECLKEPEEIRLFFDIDKLADEEDYEQFLEWLTKVSEVFGPYSIGGYSNDRIFAVKYGFKFIDGDTHFLSAHIVFYDTKIKAEDLMTIMVHRYRSFVNHEVHEEVDHQIYKLRTRQLMRHVLSRKYYGPGDNANRDNAGYILNDLKPEHQIITPDGQERLIPKDE